MSLIFPAIFQVKQDPDSNMWIPLCKETCWALFHVFKITINNLAGCDIGDASVVAACEAAGLGPEDPLADACAFGFGWAFNKECKHLMDEGLSMTYDACMDHVC